MRHIIKNLYTFGELSGDAQQKAICEHYDINVTDTFWSESIIEDWVNLLDSLGFTDAEISWSGFSSQGDGASFVSGVDFARLAQVMANAPSPCESWLSESANDRASVVGYRLEGWPASDESLWRWFDWLSVDTKSNCFGIDIVRRSSRYSHAYTCGVEFNFDHPKNSPDTDELLEAFRSLSEDVETLRKALCLAIYNDLQETYNDLTGEDAIAETLNANCYEFDGRGNIYRD